MELAKCSSNLSTASNNFYPTSLASVPAVYLSKAKASLSLSVAFSSHSAVSASTAYLEWSPYKAANSFN
jgi:chitodextrinase